jgi:hypothetical protein
MAIRFILRIWTVHYYETVIKGHGRIEIRRCWAVSDALAFENIRHHEGWADLQSIVRVQRERRQGANIRSKLLFISRV